MEIVFKIARDKPESLQNQIRRNIVDAIVNGSFPAGERLPSTRQLSRSLKVSRNTVVQVYNSLADDGYLAVCDRSGFFVNRDITACERSAARAVPEAGRTQNDASSGPWLRNLKFRPSRQAYIKTPLNSHTYPYPFIYGQIDPALFPISAWRECSRQALARTQMDDWTSDAIFQDDPQLIEQICSKLLPRRGIFAKTEEVLITLGAQNALYIAAALFSSEASKIAIENPGYSDMRNAFLRHGATLVPIEVDANGLVVDERLEDCRLVYTTPSHQYPTAVTLSLERREALLNMSDAHQFLIIEDDYENEINFSSSPLPALKSLRPRGNVLYVSSLSKSMFPGLRIGYMVGPPEFIAEARALRRQMYRHPPANNQRTTALFMSLGHYDGLMARLRETYRARWEIMRQAIATHLPDVKTGAAHGGTSFWLEGPEGLDSGRLADQALARGVVIEPGGALFHTTPRPKNTFRLGLSSIATDRIEPGIKLLSEVMRAHLSNA